MYRHACYLYIISQGGELLSVAIIKEWPSVFITSLAASTMKRRHCKLNSLPQELFDKIVEYLSLSDYCNLVLVCKRPSSKYNVIFDSTNHQHLKGVYKKTDVQITSYNEYINCICNELRQDEFYAKSSWIASICGHQRATIFSVTNKQVEMKYHLYNIAIVESEDCNGFYPFEPTRDCLICKQKNQFPRNSFIVSLCKYLEKQNVQSNFIYYLYEINT